MNPLVKRASIVLLALGACTAFLREAESGFWPPPWYLFLPDLEMASVQPSSIGPKYARLIITNDGLSASPACWIRVAVNTVPPVVKYVQLSSMPPDSGYGIDVHMGISLFAGPGLETEARVDVFGQVTELDESNNWASFLAPVW